MSKVNIVSEDVKAAIKEIIAKYNLDRNSQIVYGVGADIGDGFMSKTVAVDIISGEKTLHLFLKYGLNVKNSFVPLDKLYATERHFYNVICPNLLKFAENKGVEDALRDVPKCFAASEKNIVALENLKKKGYEMVDSQKPLNADHISTTFKSIARFHALCFAFREQCKEKYEAITKDLKYFLEKTEDLFERASSPLYSLFLKELDPVADKLILDHRKNVLVDLLEYFKGLNCTKSKNSILTKGDCWSNNLMYLYENGNKQCPVDVALVDWQTANVESVVNDLSMFFFTGAAIDELKKFKHYLKVYHDELSAHMKKFGIDPEKILSFPALEEEWRQHCRFGYGMAIMFLRVMVAPKPDELDIEEMHNNSENNERPTLETKLVPAYINRLKDLTEFCIENKFI